MLFRSTALAVFVATATASNSTGPFALHITGKGNSSIDGYAAACHAGAAIEGLCYSAGSTPPAGSVTEFYFNYTAYNSDTGAPLQPGWVTYLLSAGSGNGTITVPSSMRFIPNFGSNVLTALIYPSVEDGTPVYFHPDNGTLYIAGGYDDSQFNATYPDPVPTLGNLTNFHVCDQFTGGYYYESLAWVSTLPPRNPSCQAVDVSIQQVS
ncbi:uncharacterized protein GGS22DRAFT_176619 [Annulohypoxylon maeteangense]|uniref:uncharacterized protein n=1 Tax=Annulohypoxylon maeteangense TaxID=1927788 RepID=UPI0020082676|nr:uncharacterized protein GGS22DRAFT_176619 [Annulohypoxylon maeteangense]KAI0879874.1 hypothetical protein GGS22DRAFT_176619 [Annulohypoxylon maeteangense]